MTSPRRLLNILTLRCAAASELASRAMDEPLGFPERLALRGHWLVCSPCRLFRDQLVVLREAGRRHKVRCSEFDEGGESLSRSGRARIGKALRDAMDEGKIDEGGD